MQSYYCLIEKLPGLSKQEQKLLKTHGIDNTKQLLEKAANPQGQNLLANQLHIHNQHLKKWVALADLARIPSVGYQYCGLLLHSGIASVAQLILTPPHRLHQQILRLHIATMQRKDLCPPIEMVKRWVAEAKAIS